MTINIRIDNFDKQEKFCINDILITKKHFVYDISYCVEIIYPGLREIMARFPTLKKAVEYACYIHHTPKDIKDHNDYEADKLLREYGG